MAILKAGTVVYWNKTGARCYWNTDLNNPVDFLSEEFLEGEDAGHGYTEQFAFDVPHEGTSIPPSMTDNIAGTITGALVEKNGVNFYPIRMPFTFYNLDGQNRDDSTKSLKVFINTDDVSGDTSKAKKDKETKAIVDSVTGDTADGLKKALSQTDNADDAGKISLGKKVLYGGLILLVLGGIYYLVTRNKNKEIVVTNQNIPVDNSQMRNMIPQPKFYTTQP
jgi:hypothetical protein